MCLFFHVCQYKQRLLVEEVMKAVAGGQVAVQETDKQWLGLQLGKVFGGKVCTGLAAIREESEQVR